MRVWYSKKGEITVSMPNEAPRKYHSPLKKKKTGSKRDNQIKYNKGTETKMNKSIELLATSDF